MKKDHVYMAVTCDKYELPVYITETAREMSEILGCNRNTIYTSIYQGLTGKYNNLRIIRVDL